MLYLALLTCIFLVIVPVAAAEGLQFYYQQKYGFKFSIWTLNIWFFQNKTFFLINSDHFTTYDLLFTYLGLF